MPVRARLPLIAQITGAVAVTALVIGPWWAAIPTPRAVPTGPQAAAAPPAPAVPPAPPVPEAPVRPAHVNLDVRHTFANADISIAVDGKPVLETQLPGRGKRFKVFGKREERRFTRTLDLQPGVRVVRVRLRSAADKFDETRTERFDLGSASVAGLKISADKSGLSLVADRPPAPRPAPRPAPPQAPAAPAALAVPAARADAAAATAQIRQEASAIAEILQSMRSMLIAIAGFVASTATAFVIQEFLRSRRGLIFADATGAASAAVETGERRRRKRGRKTPSQ